MPHPITPTPHHPHTPSPHHPITPAPPPPRSPAPLLLLLPLLLAILTLLALIHPAHAARRSAAIVVNSPGDVRAADGACTLREAVLNANADDQSGSTDCAAGSGADTITFSLAPGAVISITAQPGGAHDLPISGTLTIAGPGAARLAVSQAPGHSYRLFQVQPGAVFTITDITLRDFNSASPSWQGPAIYNEGGYVAVHRVHFLHNRDASSGAIFSTGGQLHITDSEFRHNAAVSGNGGAINLDSDAVIRNTLFYSNTASNLGGAIAVSSGVTVTIENGRFLHNAASNDGGAIGIGGNFPLAHVTIAHTTLAHNRCFDCEGGAITTFAVLTVTNSTLSGNRARTGGAMYINESSLDFFPTTILHSTIVDNHSDPGGGGGLFIRRGTNGFFKTLRMHASIVANNSGGLDCETLFSGEILSLGANLVESGCTALFSTPADRPGVDPQLAPLQDNGGRFAPDAPPHTHALLAASPAVDLGGCYGSLITLDARYAPRPAGAACDAGAYEFGATPPPPPQPAWRIYLPALRH